MCLYIINIKRKSKVDHCGNEVGLMSISELPTCLDKKDEKSVIHEWGLMAIVTVLVFWSHKMTCTWRVEVTELPGESAGRWGMLLLSSTLDISDIVN